MLVKTSLFLIDRVMQYVCEPLSYRCFQERESCQDKRKWARWTQTRVHIRPLEPNLSSMVNVMMTASRFES